jgi:hypothetical protein
LGEDKDGMTTPTPLHHRSCSSYFVVCITLANAIVIVNPFLGINFGKYPEKILFKLKFCKNKPYSPIVRIIPQQNKPT